MKKYVLLQMGILLVLLSIGLIMVVNSIPSVSFEGRMLTIVVAAGGIYGAIQCFKGYKAWTRRDV